jgi:beta-lactam-binding protein with PASTA domain/tRNA A-37 threonylcarbamoyl transferase component Bud32
MAVSDTLLNTLFDGRYRIVRKLGTGGMANVYLAEDEVLGRRVAIKILNDRHAGDDQFVERFRREAKNAASLSHPNIVSIYDRGEAEGTYYIAMEYLDGRSLKELIVARGPAPVNVAIEYARQILAAIRFAHRHGIVHRDIKPHNVLVDAEGRLKVTDFGIARAGASQMTEAGSIIGTAQYLSPEQAKGAPVDQTSDLYSVGVVLYELLTGVVPFSGDTPVEIAMKHLSSAPESPSAKRGEIPRELDLIVQRALAKDPVDRYQSAEEMDEDLARVARGASVSPATEEAATAIISRPPPTAITAITPPRARETVPYAPPPAYYDYDEPRRRALWPWFVALLFVAAAVVGGYFLYDQIQTQLTNSKVAVENYRGQREINAVRNIRDQGLRVQVVRQYNDKVETTFVFKQDPQPGERIDKGNYVTIFSSLGPPLTEVPNVVGEKLDQALDDLRQANLRWRVVRVDNDAPEDEVISQRPSGGQAQQESVVVLRVSNGPKPVIVPNVVGSSFDSANSSLLGRGFAVRRREVESDQPKDTVIAQSPDAGTYQPPGTPITLSVSKGPKTSTVPDVTSIAQSDAIAQLKASGFEVRVVPQPVSDSGQDGIVQTQDPAGGTAAPPGSTVTIAVGKFSGTATTSPGPP